MSFVCDLSLRDFIMFTFFFERCVDHRDLHSFPHDALPICVGRLPSLAQDYSLGLMFSVHLVGFAALVDTFADRKSTRLNSSHVSISYAVFCLKKKSEFRHNRICI